MTEKYYFRNLALHDLGFPADDTVIKIQKFIETKLTNLNQYPNLNYFNYGKNESDIIFYYHIITCNAAINTVDESIHDPDYLQTIILPFINKTYNLDGIFLWKSNKALII